MSLWSESNNLYSCSVPGREELALSYQESLVNALDSGCSYLVYCYVIRGNCRVGFCLKSSRPVGVSLTFHRLLQICDKLQILIKDRENCLFFTIEGDYQLESFTDQC